MRRHVWTGAVLLTLLAGGRAPGGEPGCCEPPQAGFFQRWHPVGGWDPYGGGLLHWWNPHCFPRSGTPDDYCRKKLPPVCWPPYPPYFISGLPEDCPAPGPDVRTGDQAQGTAPSASGTSSSESRSSPKDDKPQGKKER
jgi:hypothetical protein